MPTNDFLPFAIDVNAGVMSQADYAERAGLGVVPGLADPDFANKAWRQGANMAAAIGEMIKAQGIDALDNGEIASLSLNIISALKSFLLPLSGGEMTGNIVVNSSYPALMTKVSNSYLRLGNLDFNGGASLYLNGKDRITDTGQFSLTAYDGVNRKILNGAPDGTLTWDGNNIVTDKVETITPTFDTSHFKPYNDYSSYKPTLKKMGKVCMVRGVISPLAEIPAGGMDFATIPSGYRPPFNVFTLCQGSGANKWLLTITDDTGAMNISRYSVSTWNGDPIPAGSWLPFTLTYICA